MAWQDLLADVLPALDASPWKDRWRLGGGTALAIQINHRISYDIDLFFEDVEGSPLKYFVPYSNPLTAAICKTCQYPGFYLKLERDDGEIDFLRTETFYPDPVKLYDFNNRRIAIHSPNEIIAKKLIYRPARLKERDVFDALATWDAGLLDVDFFKDSPLFSREVIAFSIKNMVESYEEACRTMDIQPGFRHLQAVKNLDRLLDIISGPVKDESPSP